MGSYTQCWLDDLFIGSSKNDVDPEIISLFRPSDKHVVSNPTENIPAILKEYQETQKEEPELEIIYYEANATLIRDRLNVMGYTINTAKKAFQAWFDGEITSLSERIEAHKDDEKNEHVSLFEIYSKEYELISSITPEKWLAALDEIRRSKIKPNTYRRYEGPHENTLIGYMLSNDWYGFPGYDMNVPLRIILENAKDDQKLIYDVTDLVWSECFDASDDLVEHGIQEFADVYSSKAKIIILTEGRTDAYVLKESLSILYPHLAEYYSFMEFENAKVGGGVGSLLNMVKAFSGAGVINNIVAIFDNDTAANAAIKNIEKIKLPTNIEILKLPEIKMLTTYPTIGPTGNINMDVNGVAASIELYFGEDVLKLDGINLTPIQWTGYEASVKQYQGEVLNKKLLQEAFRSKLDNVVLNGENSLDSTWDPLRTIFKSIFSAFESKNESAICGLVHAYYDS